MATGWTEQLLQDATYHYCVSRRHSLVIPNSCLFNWESDVIGLLPSGYVAEFEIKISRSDFKADAKKARTQVLEAPDEHTLKSANYFYYVVPRELVAVGEVPEYAGLIYVSRASEFGINDREYFATVNKVAPLLHKKKATVGQIFQLMRATNARYWRQRLEANRKDNET